MTSPHASPSASKPLLIVHAGAGKTGSTSIQYSLKAHRELLQQAGVWYLGLMLEHGPTPLADWQMPTTQVPGNAQPAFQQQVRQVLGQLLDAASARGIHTLVWSNEQFFRNSAFVMPLLHELVAQQRIELKVVIYLRRHDAWARSAYLQWGLKHKTYAGRLRRFAEWIKRSPPTLAPLVDKWVEGFGERVVLRNFDALDDVVGDFVQLCGLGTQRIEPVRVNEALSAESTYLRALFNGLHDRPVHVKEFNAVVSEDPDLFMTPADYLNRLLPSADDLGQVRHQLRDDRSQIDAQLNAQGQPSLETSPLTVTPPSVSTDRLVGALCRLVLLQSQRLHALEQRLAQGGEGRPA